MSFGAPPSKQAQEQEAAAQRSAEEQAPDLNEGTVEVIGEDVSPPPAPVAEAPAGDPPAETPPAEPTVAPNPRDEIARKFRERRAKDREQFVGHQAEPQPLFLNEQAAPEAAPAPADPAHPAPQTFEIKVFGKSEQVSREQLIAMADLSAEDAEAIPEKSLVKIAQINEAAKRRLEAAKTTPFGAPAAPVAPAATPAAPQEPTTEQNDPEASRGKPTLKDHLEKVQYGDPEEAEAAFVSAIDQRLEERQLAERARTIASDNDRAIEAFSQANPDITAHETASRYLLTETTAEIINELRALGAPEENLAPLHFNPAKAVQAYREARLSGLNVRTPTEILDAAGKTVRTQFGLTREGTRPSPSAAPAPATNRVEAKRALTQQPTRSGSPVAIVPPANDNNRSSTIQKMRAARGQSVA
jgi:hypothetical protein